jgi:hypothetical protein
MAGLLRQLDADMSRAGSIEEIHEIAADAEQLMRAENSDWFGVMRFHDVELITLTPPAPSTPFQPYALRPVIVIMGLLLPWQQRSHDHEDGCGVTGAGVLRDHDLTVVRTTVKS